MDVKKNLHPKSGADEYCRLEYEEDSICNQMKKAYTKHNSCDESSSVVGRNTKYELYATV